MYNQDNRHEFDAFMTYFYEVVHKNGFWYAAVNMKKIHESWKKRYSEKSK